FKDEQYRLIRCATRASERSALRADFEQTAPAPRYARASPPNLGGELPLLSLHAVRSSAEDPVAVHTGIVQLIGRITDGLLASRLRSPIGGFAGVGEFHREFDPIRIRHRNELAVLTAAPRSEHQLCRFREGDRCVIDNLPGLVNTSSPGKPVKPSGSLIVFG